MKQAIADFLQSIDERPKDVDKKKRFGDWEGDTIIGKEFAGHKQMSQELGAEIYFAHPYSSWERGLNENTNGLIRQYIPKKTDFNKDTQEMVEEIESALNSRPRKSLNFSSPEEILRDVA